mmetsp:Transcript_30965/g.45920  ORF Transcript_30965/g.45920 Transcript_30965/m.45920 type:complete len:169 (+) Transcript_30965:1404-1910(+)
MGLICCVCLVVDGLVWFLLTKDHFDSDNSSVQASNVPDQMNGVFEAEDERKWRIHLYGGQWTPNLRLLSLKAGSYYFETRQRWCLGAVWCRRASYQLSFNDKLSSATGSVVFGWWQVPESIVSLRVAIDGDDLVIGQAWFMGDPQKEFRLRRIVQPSAVADLEVATHP